MNLRFAGTQLLALFVLFFLPMCSQKNTGPNDNQPVTDKIQTKLDLSATPPSGSSYNKDTPTSFIATFTTEYPGTMPTGNTKFTLDGKNACVSSFTSTGGQIQAICQISVVAGDHTITAQYDGDNAYEASNVASLVYTVNSYPSHITTFTINESDSPTKFTFGDVIRLKVFIHKDAPDMPPFSGGTMQFFINQETSYVFGLFKGNTASAEICTDNGAITVVDAPDGTTFSCTYRLQADFVSDPKDSYQVSFVAKYAGNKYYTGTEASKKSVTINRFSSVFTKVQSDKSIYHVNDTIVIKSVLTDGGAVFDEAKPPILKKTLQGSQASCTNTQTYPVCKFVPVSNPGDPNVACAYPVELNDVGCTANFAIQYSGDAAHNGTSSQPVSVSIESLYVLTITTSGTVSAVTVGKTLNLTGTIQKPGNAPTAPPNINGLKIRGTIKENSYDDLSTCTINMNALSFSCAYVTKMDDPNYHRFQLMYKNQGPTDPYTSAAAQLADNLITKIPVTLSMSAPQTAEIDESFKINITLKVDQSNYAKDVPLNNLLVYKKSDKDKPLSCNPTNPTPTPDGKTTVACDYTTTIEDYKNTPITFIASAINDVNYQSSADSQTDVQIIQQIVSLKDGSGQFVPNPAFTQESVTISSVLTSRTSLDDTKIHYNILNSKLRLNNQDICTIKGVFNPDAKETSVTCNYPLQSVDSSDLDVQVSYDGDESHQAMPKTSIGKLGINKCTSDNATIDFSQCDDYGCTLQIICNSGMPDNFGQSENNSQIRLNISSISTSNGILAPLQNNPGDIDSKWWSNETSLTCNRAGNTITCTNFFPVSDKFALKGSFRVGATDVPVELSTVTVNSNNPPSETIVSCGFAYSANATTAQRLYNCSKKVKNFAGLGNGDGTVKYFDQSKQRCPTSGVDSTCNADKNWFLIYCYDTIGDHCTWLTPVIQPDNPLVTDGNKQLLSPVGGKNAQPISQFVNQRFLWSGTLDDNYDLADAVDFHRTILGDCYYNIYSVVSANGGGNRGQVAARVGVDKDPPCNKQQQSHPSVCTKDMKTLLQSQVYQWNLPSYPLLLMITGGNNGQCETGGKSLPYTCLSVERATPYFGFRATDPIPGFTGQTANNLQKIWSSSLSDDNVPTFAVFDPSIGAVSVLNYAKYGVKCVSSVGDLFTTAALNSSKKTSKRNIKNQKH